MTFFRRGPIASASRLPGTSWAWEKDLGARLRREKASDWTELPKEGGPWERGSDVGGAWLGAGNFYRASL